MGDKQLPPGPEGLPPELADAIEPVLPELTAEILATIPREVPEYARPFEGSFGRGIQVGVSEALSRFVALIREPDAAATDAGRDVYVGLGRGELRQGRSLDSLQAAYRVGARVAWRRTSEAAERAGLPPSAIYALADAIFAYIDGISAESVEGYAAEQSLREGERETRRTRLLATLAQGTAAALEDLERLAAEAGWRVPDRVAALACEVDDAGPIALRVQPETLANRQDGLGCVIVADPEAPAAGARLDAACEGRPAALGPAAAPLDLAASWREARATWEAMAAGLLAPSGSSSLVRSEERLVELVLLDGRSRLGRVADRRLAGLEGETEASRSRLLLTLSSYLRHQGRATDVATELNVHPQTVRYRIARLRDLLGGQLDDPDARFELEAALRTLALGARPSELSTPG